MNTFFCSVCQEEFQKGWSDEEAKAECQELWGEHAEADMPLVCEDCFTAIMQSIGATA